MAEEDMKVNIGGIEEKYHQNDTITIFSQFTDNGVPINVTNPKVSVFHLDNNTLVQDLTESTMATCSSSYEGYYYKAYTIQNNALDGRYGVLIQATYSSEAIQGSSHFAVRKGINMPSGKDIIVWANFTENGSAITPTNTPKVQLHHYQDSALTQDVTDGEMTLVVGTSSTYTGFYYYKHSIPTTATVVSSYGFRTQATYNSTTIAGTDGFALTEVEGTLMQDPMVTLYNIVKDNISGDFNSAKVSTTWYNERFTEPQVIVGHIGTPDKVKVIGDTLREHKSNYYIDTWITETAGSDTSIKRSRYRFDEEIKRIIRNNKDDPSPSIRRIRIEHSEPLDEISKEKKIFRTRHRVLVHWFENI